MGLGEVAGLLSPPDDSIERGIIVVPFSSIKQKNNTAREVVPRGESNLQQSSKTLGRGRFRRRITRSLHELARLDIARTHANGLHAAVFVQDANLLQIRLPATFRQTGHFLTDTALSLGLTAPHHLAANLRPLSAVLTDSSHEPSPRALGTRARFVLCSRSKGLLKVAYGRLENQENHEQGIPPALYLPGM